VQAINDSPLVFDLEFIVLEEPCHYSLHRRFVRIKQMNAPSICGENLECWHSNRKFEMTEFRHLELDDHPGNLQ
jgi:hypothetical protein